MTKAAFSDAYLRSLEAPQKGQKAVWDDKLPSFGLRISQGGSKTFVLNKDNSLITIGRFGVVTLSKARTEAKRLLAERTLGKVRPQSITFPAALQLFLSEKTKSRRPRTVQDLKARIERHFRLQGQLGDMSYQDVAKRLARIKAPSEHDHALAAAKTFFTWCHNRRYIDDNPTRGLSPRGHTSRARVLSDAELKSIWEASGNLGNFGAIVRLLIATGQRRGEIAGLQLSNIQGEEICLRSEQTKNHRAHTIPLGNFGKQPLEPILKSFAKPSPTSSLLFPARGSSDKPFNGWSKAKTTLDELSGVDDWTLHDLRRTFASTLAKLGTPIHIIERLLNHVSGSISGVAAVYNRHSYLDESRVWIERYEAHLTTILNNPG